MRSGRVSLPLPDKDREFIISERDGRWLVAPSKRKFDWEPHEFPYRSVILDAHGHVLSSGFPKFHNFGEPKGAEADRALLDALRGDGHVWIGEKLDGSLAIRSVIDDEVVFRTRGSFDGGPFGPMMRAVAREKYPALLDPAFMPGHSLLFEFVSADPEYQIVIPYEEDDLVLLGGVDHHDLSLFDLPALQDISATYELSLVPVLELPTDVDELLGAVRDWKGREGIVARCAGGQALVKVKSDAYLLIHRLRTQLTAKSVRELCHSRGITSLADYQDVIVREFEADWEMVSHSSVFVEAYLDGIARARQEFDDLKVLVDAAISKYGADRKAFATEFALTLDRRDRSAAFLIYTGRHEQAREFVRDATLDEIFDRLGAQERDAEQEALATP